MLSKVKCVAFQGLQVVEVDVEANISNRGIPSFDIVGLPNKSIEESKHRIKSAFINSGYDFPAAKITVNLAPADIHKIGSAYDLPIAVAIFCAQNQIYSIDRRFFFGELSLDGMIRNTRGAYLAVDYVNSVTGSLFVSAESAVYLSTFGSFSLFPSRTLKEVFAHLKGNILIKKVALVPGEICTNGGITSNKDYDILFNDVIGQESAKRALEISACGGHNLMLVGSPGTGKSMLAKSIVSILPGMTPQEVSEVQKIYSYMGISITNILQRPFRQPHHTISYAGMLGGGAEPLPGEVTLAHDGILFMDEFCEFTRNVLEGLRQPMQDGYITLNRNNKTVRFPAAFSLIAASNPCPCGYLGHPKRPCICSEQKIAVYYKKLSGPLADRFDLFANAFPEENFVSKLDRLADSKNLQLCKTKELIELARLTQQTRLQEFNKVCNASMTNKEVAMTCQMSKEAAALLKNAYTHLNLSPRGYYKVIKVSRTVADLCQSDIIKEEHIAEGLQYRLR